MTELERAALNRARKIANDNRKREAERRLVEILDKKGFDYIGGYTCKDGHVDFRCRQCGTVYNRSCDQIRRGNITCSVCRKQETAQRTKQNKLAKSAVARERKERRIAELEQKEEQKREQRLDEVFVCKECGKEYTPRQYMESMGLRYYSNPGYCSHECKKKNENRRGHKAKSKDTHRKRAQRYGVAYDGSITLQRLIKRDGLKCCICGGECDLNDHEWAENFGPTYPTIDHIIPMAQGGSHTWDNVQIAHAICNSKKGKSLEG